MAKKKTAPVLRVENPGSGDGQSTPVITKSYSVRDDWKDINKVNYVAFKSVDGEVQDLTVNGQPAGGGMFTTAILSVTASQFITVPNVQIIDGVYTIAHDIPDPTPGTDYTIVLTNGTCFAETEGTLTGAAEAIGPDEGVYKVTGNITIS